ncbi:MAG: AMP-binding protein, partial [Thermoanaerobaculia bacterium]
WFVAWLGALLAGALPLAGPSGGAGAAKGSHARVAESARQVRAETLVCDAGLKAELGELEAPFSVFTAEELATSSPATRNREARPDPGAIAYLQMTSGSTGVPRAVEVTHRAVFHQVDIQEEVVGAPFGKSAREVIDLAVYWLPLFHDMGLMVVLYTMLYGMDLWLLPPEAFLARPRIFLELLHSVGSSVSSGPNFGYQLCVERVGEEEVAALDLSSFRAALTGAEMVRGDTIEAFCTKFGRCGFESRAFRPCYGLAEATLAVTLDRRGEGPRSLPLPEGADRGLGLADLVGAGPPVPETELKITAPDGSSLAAGSVGEIRVRGPSVFSGYYNDPEATRETLQDGWLRTGDLGFLDDGELFVAGRVKDLLIVRGQNLMPHELEWLAESATGGGGSLRAAAFSVARGPEGEEAVVVVEVSSGDVAALHELAGRVRSRIGRELGLPVADVALVRRGRIPKTTSGKVKRGELRGLYLDGRLERLDSPA